MDGQRDDDQLTPRLTAVAALGILLFAPPLLWAYLFFAWAVVVGLVAVVVRRSGRRPG